MSISRRGLFSFLGGALVAAPAVVKSVSLMPVRGIVMPWRRPLNVEEYGDHTWIEWARAVVGGQPWPDHQISLEDWGKQLQRDEIIQALREMELA